MFREFVCYHVGYIEAVPASRNPAMKLRFVPSIGESNSAYRQHISVQWIIQRRCWKSPDPPLHVTGEETDPGDNSGHFLLPPVATSMGRVGILGYVPDCRGEAELWPPEAKVTPSSTFSHAQCKTVLIKVSKRQPGWTRDAAHGTTWGTVSAISSGMCPARQQRPPPHVLAPVPQAPGLQAPLTRL